MKSGGIFRTLFTRYSQVFLMFFSVYLFIVASALALKIATGTTFNVTGLTYGFMIYWFIMAWRTLQQSLRFYSYHSFGRKQIFIQNVWIQLIISLFAAILIQLNNALVRLPDASFIKIDVNIEKIYVKQLSLSSELSFVSTVLFLTFIMFVLAQAASMCAITTYNWNVQKFGTVITAMLLFVLAIYITLDFWPTVVLDVIHQVFGILIGSKQNVILYIIPPFVLLALIGLFSAVISLVKVKKLEIHRDLLF